MKVALSIGEDYPHLFVTADPDEVAYAEAPKPEYLRQHPYRVVAVEVSEEDWAGWQQAERAYNEWVERLDKLRVAAGGKPAG